MELFDQRLRDGVGEHLWHRLSSCGAQRHASLRIEHRMRRQCGHQVVRTGHQNNLLPG